jgi:hypothetical protein
MGAIVAGEPDSLETGILLADLSDDCPASIFTPVINE